MRIVRLVLAVSFAALAIVPGSALAQGKDPAVDKLVADWTAAFSRGDAKALASLYTDNAVRVTQDGRIVGRAAIEKEFAANFAGPWKGASVKIHTGAIQSVAPDIAVGEGTYEVTAMGPDGKAMPPARGSYVNTMVKKGGAWVLASNAAIPEPPK